MLGSLTGQVIQVVEQDWTSKVLSLGLPEHVGGPEASKGPSLLSLLPSLYFSHPHAFLSKILHWPHIKKGSSTSEVLLYLCSVELRS